MAIEESQRPKSLLLLPSSGGLVTPSDFDNQYGAPLSAALQAVAEVSRAERTSAVLEIALIARLESDDRDVPRAELFDTVQRLVAGIYRLVCQICLKESIETQGPESVDARVFLVSDTEQEPEDDVPDAHIIEGPVVLLENLFRSHRSWRTVFVPQGPEGDSINHKVEELVSQRNSSQGPHTEIRRISGAAVRSSQLSGGDSQTATRNTTTRHYSVAVGGTFDHLHIGHKLLLTMTAFLVEPVSQTNSTEPRRLIIGITKDDLLKNKKFAEYMGSWQDRQNDVADFLHTILDFGRDTSRSTTRTPLETLPGGGGLRETLSPGLVIDYVELSDPFGPTVTDESISALIISGETRSGGQAVNTKREEKNWAPLSVFEVDVLDAAPTEAGKKTSAEEEGFLDKISSTEIRRLLAEKDKS